MARFTVIIPTKNRPRFLRQAVASALAQDHRDLEIIVVEDGEGAADALAEVDGPFAVIDNRGRGPVQARNLAIGHARGEFIAFLDDDDRWTDRAYLARAAGLLSRGADFIYADGELTFEDGTPSIPFAFHADAATLAANNTILISAVCYRRSLHDRLGLLDETLTDYYDWDWYLRVARSGADMRHFRRPVVSIRVHGRNMSGGEREALRRAGLDALAAKHGLGRLILKNHLRIAEEAQPAS